MKLLYALLAVFCFDIAVLFTVAFGGGKYLDMVFGKDAAGNMFFFALVSLGVMFVMLYLAAPIPVVRVSNTREIADEMARALKEHEKKEKGEN